MLYLIKPGKNFKKISMETFELRLKERLNYMEYYTADFLLSSLVCISLKHYSEF